MSKRKCDPIRFAYLWGDLSIRVDDIMAEFDICEATAHATARRLGLGPRSDIRAKAGLCKHGLFVPNKTPEERRVAHNQYRREHRKRTNERNRGLYLKNGAPRSDAPQPTPTLMRCECGGVIDLANREGHACRFTKVA